MKIELQGVGKRFIKDWIFRNVTLDFEANKKYAITGRNGSGKSTLLQLISGLIIPTEGQIFYKDASGEINKNQDLNLEFSYCSPFQELPEELTAKEVYDFHFNFRSKAVDFDNSMFFDLVELSGQENKQVKYYSSGMKQRLKLGLCMFTESKIYFLDEPTTNLDRNGISWYKNLISTTIKEKTLFVSSNIEEEYQFCNQVINISDFK